MTIRFDTAMLVEDLEAKRKARRLTLHKTAVRINITPSTLSGMKDGKIKDITVNTLARIMDFLGETNIEKYIYEDGDY